MPARRTPPTASPRRARLDLRPRPERATRVHAAAQPASPKARKGGADEWEVVVTIEETAPGSELDLLLRQEQAQALLRLAAASRQDRS
jgi:hypothetical protein